jgi:hypothetical protein
LRNTGGNYANSLLDPAGTNYAACVPVPGFLNAGTTFSPSECTHLKVIINLALWNSRTLIAAAVGGAGVAAAIQPAQKAPYPVGFGFF